MPNRMRVLLTFSPLVLVVLSYVYATHADVPHIRAATITLKIYSQTADGQIRDLGSETIYVSADGNWSTVKRNNSNQVTQVFVADADRGGVFLVTGNTAQKLGEFRRNTDAFKAEDYRQSSQFVGETTFLGYSGFIQRVKGEGGELVQESITIPEFKKSVKTVDYEPDGSKTISEATSIILGEPERSNVTLASNIRVTAVIPDRKLAPQN